jgi:hypothetical protein
VDNVDKVRKMEKSKKKFRDSDEELSEGEAAASSASRGMTRSGVKYRRTNEGFYTSVRAVVAAHPQSFNKTPTLYLIGKLTRPPLNT